MRGYLAESKNKRVAFLDITPDMSISRSILNWSREGWTTYMRSQRSRGGELNADKRSLPALFAISLAGALALGSETDRNWLSGAAILTGMRGGMPQRLDDTEYQVED